MTRRATRTVAHLSLVPDPTPTATSNASSAVSLTARQVSGHPATSTAFVVAPLDRGSVPALTAMAVLLASLAVVGVAAVGMLTGGQTGGGITVLVAGGGAALALAAWIERTLTPRPTTRRAPHGDTPGTGRDGRVHP